MYTLNMYVTWFVQQVVGAIHWSYEWTPKNTAYHFECFRKGREPFISCHWKMHWFLNRMKTQKKGKIGLMRDLTITSNTILTIYSLCVKVICVHKNFLLDFREMSSIHHKGMQYLSFTSQKIYSIFSYSFIIFILRNDSI